MLHRILILSGLLLGATLWAQESPAPDAADEATEPATQAESETRVGDADALTDEDIEALLDLEDYAEQDDDDFIPSVDVRYEQSIPFPTDI